MRVTYPVAGLSTCAFVAAIASAFPRCARFAHFPLAHSLAADPVTAQRKRRVGLRSHTSTKHPVTRRVQTSVVCGKRRLPVIHPCVISRDHSPVNSALDK